MRSRVLIVLLGLFLLAAAMPISGKATIESLNQPPVPGDMGWCTGDCEFLESGNQKAVVKFDLDADAQAGTVTYADHGVRYAGRPFAIDGTITSIEYWSDAGGDESYGWHLIGTYQPHGAVNIPSGDLQVWFHSGPTWTYVTVYLSNFTTFSYLNQGSAIKFDVPVFEG